MPQELDRFSKIGPMPHHGLGSDITKLSGWLADLLAPPNKSLSNPYSQSNLDYQDGFKSLLETFSPIDDATGMPKIFPVESAPVESAGPIDQAIAKSVTKQTRPTMWPDMFAQRAERVPQSIGPAAQQKAKDLASFYNLPRGASRNPQSLEAFMDQHSAMSAIRKTNARRYVPSDPNIPQQMFKDLSTYESIPNNSATPQQVLEQNNLQLPSSFYNRRSKRRY